MFRNVRFFERVRDTGHTTGDGIEYKEAKAKKTSDPDEISTVLNEQQSRKISFDKDELFRKLEEQRFRKITSDDGDFSGLLDQPESESIEFMSPSVWGADSPDEANDTIRSPGTFTPGEDTPFIIAKTIAGFLNTSGGNLIMDLPVPSDNQSEEYHPGIQNDSLSTKNTVVAMCEKIIIDSVQRYFDADFFSHYTRFLSLEAKKIRGRTICRVQIQKSDRPLFVQHGNEDVFFVRTGAQTREIRKIKDLYAYISHHFQR